MNECEMREPLQAMIAQQGRGNTLKECSPPRALNAGESDSRLRTPCPSLWVSSSVPGTKNRHVVFFSMSNVHHLDKLRVIAKTYKLPYIQIYVLEDRMYFACFKAVTKERYRKILKTASKRSLAEFDKYGHVLHPITAIPAKQLVELVDGETPTSRAHHIMYARTLPKVALLVGSDKTRVFRKVIHG